MARPRGRTKTERLTVYLDGPHYAALDALADREGVPLAALGRRAIVEFLERREPTTVPPKPAVQPTPPSDRT